MERNAFSRLQALGGEKGERSCALHLHLHLYLLAFV